MSGKHKANNPDDYFFGTTTDHYNYKDDENSILTEFGWNIPVDFSQIHPDFSPTNDLSAPTIEVENSPTESGVSSAAAADPPADTASIKSKKKGEKRMKQPRFAFVTKSEVDHLEDGYRWRKYGQKAVKNSPYPSKCMVKKRIERSSEDPSIVITTYEGQHCHLSGAGGFIYSSPYVHGGGLAVKESRSGAVVNGEGLLGDIVSPTTRNGLN